MGEQLDRKGKLSPGAIVGIILFIFCGISLYIRIALPYDQVFVHGAVWFQGTDAWYHMRHIENLVHHFPHINSFDPYMLYPGGGGGPGRPFFDWLVAGVIWLVSFGSPTQHTIDVVGAYIPPILGTLTLIPVYFIGKELFNRWVGVISAALVAILPGEFLHRSLLGFTDHHVAEALFGTVSILFLILAVRRAREKQISFGHFLDRNWSIITRPLIYTLLAGIFLGIYLLSWQGGLLFIFIIFVYLVIQFIIDHLRRKSTDYLCIVGALSFLIAFIMLLLLLGKGGLDTIYRVSLIIAVVTPIALSGISRLMASKDIKPAYYPLTLLGLAGIGFAVFHAVNPSLLESMFSRFGIFSPAGASLTITEMNPLLLPYGSFSLKAAWFDFTTSFFISFISLGMLIYVAVKERSSDKTLFLVWSIIMLIAVLGQRRFSYYFALNAALLTGYFSWRMLDFAGLRKLLAAPGEAMKAVKRAKKKKAKAGRKTFLQPRGIWVRVIVVGVLVFFLVFFPNIGRTKALAQWPPLITEGWYSSLTWLKDNSPEPFGDPDFYYELYETPFQYPETAYGVMSWWDYGYWIMRISHRIPNSNPGQANAAKVAHFFIAQDEDSVNQIMDKLGSKYVIVDYVMPTAAFHAMPEWAGRSVEEFFETYYHQTEAGGLQPVTLFYPDYYRSMVVRLYSFDGKAVVPTESRVISYEKKVSREGIGYKEITGSKSFPTYEDAQAYVSSQASEDYRIVSTNPLASPVPLAELSSYKLVHESADEAKIANESLPGVKIFRYLGSGGT